MVGDELRVSGLEAATSLIQNAKNLLNAVILTVKSAYIASTKARNFEQNLSAASIFIILTIVLVSSKGEHQTKCSGMANGSAAKTTFGERTGQNRTWSDTARICEKFLMPIFSFF